jgi:peptidylprolyl isomerase
MVLLACLGLAQPGCADKDLVKTPSGLRYKDLRVGEGKAAQNGDTVEVIYTGWLLDGKQFDSNVDGKPLVVTIGKSQMIPGWHEGLVGMKAGGKRKLIIPPDLAYGTAGSGKDIPPNATLVFEVELLKLREPGQEEGK